MSISREETYKKSLIKKIRDLMISKKIFFEISSEVFFCSSKGKRAYIDLIIQTKTKIIPIEVKHDQSKWTKKEIAWQINRYNQILKQNPKNLKVILTSPKGKYGLDEKSLLKTLKEIL